MPIVCAGISHHSAPVRLRERLTLTDAEQHTLFVRARSNGLERRTRVSEVALLSTCNRVEIYGASKHPAHEFTNVPLELFGLLMTDGHEVRVEELRPYLYSHLGIEAVRHLCRVAAGLDSMVLGESEILGQVQAAHRRALTERVTGPVLDAAFHTAVRAGRRARAETGLAERPASVSSEAIRLAEELAGPLAARRILIVGSGKMGRLTGRVFRRNGVRDLTVVSRTKAHAQAVVAECGGTALGWHHLADAIRDADVVLASTAAPHAVITTELVQSALGTEQSPRPRLFVDIAVPRDVDPQVGALPNVRVVDMDGIKCRLHSNVQERRRAVPHAEAIVEEELHYFESWRHEAELRPLIRAMRSRTEAIRRDELDRLLRGLGEVSPEMEAQLDKFSRALVNKLMHEPTRRLKQEIDPTRCDTYAEVTRELFGIGQEEQAHTTWDT